MGKTEKVSSKKKQTENIYGVDVRHTEEKSKTEITHYNGRESYDFLMTDEEKRKSELQEVRHLLDNSKDDELELTKRKDFLRDPDILFDAIILGKYSINVPTQEKKKEEITSENRIWYTRQFEEEYQLSPGEKNAITKKFEELPWINKDDSKIIDQINEETNISENYACAYNEIIKILIHTKKEDVNRISAAEVVLWKQNMKKSHIFKVDENKPIEEQNILNETKAIIANIFKKYWATSYQQERINEKEKYDLQHSENVGYEDYSPNAITNNENKFNEIDDYIAEDVFIDEYKESMFKRILNKIKTIFNK